MKEVIIFFLIHWNLSGFLQSFYLHRYISHNQFEMSKFWEKFFYYMCFLVNGSGYESPYAYGVMHRLHHAHTDKEGDPHSPSFLSSFLNLHLKSINFAKDIRNDKIQVDEKFTSGIIRLKKFDSFACHSITRSLFILLYICVYFYFQPPWFMYLLLLFHISNVSLAGNIVNWFSHKYGYRNYNLNNTSTNLVSFDLIGELLHNNHHAKPLNPNFAHRWFEFDGTYFVIKFLDKLGVVRLSK